MTNDEFNNDTRNTMSCGCGSFLAFCGIVSAIFIVCFGNPPVNQFLPILLIVAGVLGTCGFILGYLLGRFNYTPCDMNNLTCTHCGQRIVPLDQRPAISSNNGPLCPFCKQPINSTPTASSTSEESSSENRKVPQ